MPWEMCNQYHKYRFLVKDVSFSSLCLFLGWIAHQKVKTKDYEMPRVSYPFIFYDYLGNPRKIIPFSKGIQVAVERGKF